MSVQFAYKTSVPNSGDQLDLVYHSDQRIFSLQNPVTPVVEGSRVNLVLAHGLGHRVISTVNGLRVPVNEFNKRVAPGAALKAASIEAAVHADGHYVPVTARGSTFPGYYTSEMQDLAAARGWGLKDFMEMDGFGGVAEHFENYFRAIKRDSDLPLIFVGRSYLGALGSAMCYAINKRALARGEDALVAGAVSMSSSFPGCEKIVDKNTTSLFAAHPDVDVNAVKWISEIYKTFGMPEDPSILPQLILTSECDPLVLPEERRAFHEYATAHPEHVAHFDLEGDFHDMFSPKSSKGFEKRARRMAYLSLYRFIDGVLKGNPTEFLLGGGAHYFSFSEEAQKSQEWYAPLGRSDRAPN